MNVMEIQGTPIQIKEYQGKRVVTFKDIDTVHKRREGTASRNFNQNRNRFIEDVDFFKIKITDNEIRSQFGISPNAGGTVMLITETGFLTLMKPLKWLMIFVGSGNSVVQLNNVQSCLNLTIYQKSIRRT